MSGITIEGIQEAQAAANKLLAAVKPDGAFGEAVKATVIAAEGGVVRRAHVRSGAYKASIRGEALGLHGQVYVDPSAQNPSGVYVMAYAPVEEARGGDHAAFYRTVTEDQQMLGESGMRAFQEALP